MGQVSKTTYYRMTYYNSIKYLYDILRRFRRENIAEFQALQIRMHIFCAMQHRSESVSSSRTQYPSGRRALDPQFGRYMPYETLSENGLSAFP